MNRAYNESPMDVSLALSEDSACTTLVENKNDGNNNPGRTLRRGRSSLTPKRNYRIVRPEDASYIYQLQDECYGQSSLPRKVSLGRREGNAHSPLVITAPTPPSLSSSQSMTSSIYSSVAPPTPTPPLPPQALVMRPPWSFSSPPSAAMTAGSMLHNTEEQNQRLSSVSSTTGYSSARSSARSSLRSSDSNDAILSSSLSDARRAALVQCGRLTQLDRICGELLDTERTYLHDLSDVIQGYLNFFVEHRNELGLPFCQIASPFGCIERLHAFHTHFYTQLDRCELDCFQICACFVENARQFQVYVDYCLNFRRMLSSLADISSSPPVRAALERRQLALGHSLPLAAYLLKPVQRVLKYPLFIENMLRHMHDVPEGFSADREAVVRRALEEMTTQAAIINEEKKKDENEMRIGVIRHQLHGWPGQFGDIDSYGPLVAEATFRLHGTKKTRHVFLLEEVLVVAKSGEAGGYECKKCIWGSDLTMNENPSPDPLSFQVISFENPRDNFIFTAANSEQKRAWLRELKKVMLDQVKMPAETRRLLLNADSTPRRTVFERPEFADVNVKSGRNLAKFLEKRRKSEQKDRGRSLSASRVAAETMFPVDHPMCPSSTAPRYKLFGVDDCPADPGPSQSAPPARLPVCRTRSASAIEDISGMPPTRQPKRDTSSRSRFMQARKGRALPPSREEPSYHAYPIDSLVGGYNAAPCQSSRLSSHEIESTFAQLYQELQLVGQDPQPPAHQPPPPPPTRRLDELVRCKSTTPENGVRMRSRSLSRLDVQFEEELPEQRPDAKTLLKMLKEPGSPLFARAAFAVVDRPSRSAFRPCGPAQSWPPAAQPTMAANGSPSYKKIRQALREPSALEGLRARQRSALSVDQCGLAGESVRMQPRNVRAMVRQFEQL